LEVTLRDRFISLLIPGRRKIKYICEDPSDTLILETEEEAFHFPNNSTAQILGVHNACTYNTLRTRGSSCNPQSRPDLQFLPAAVSCLQEGPLPDDEVVKSTRSIKQ